MGENPNDPRYPAAPGHPAEPEGRQGARWLVALAAAVAVVAIVLATWFIARSGGDGQQAATPPPSSAPPSPTVTVTQTETPSSSPSASAPAPCQASDLAPSIATDGAAAGTGYYALLFRNTGSAPCTADANPSLIGVTASGTEEALPLTDALDGSLAAMYPIGPAGPVATGARAGILVSRTNDPTNCPTGGSTYVTLKVDLGGGQVVSMPYPAELAPAACLRQHSRFGPLSSP